MSKITNPTTELSVSCGFYDSSESGSRKYYASQMSRIFDGIIRDGVFSSIGDCFVVNAGVGNTITVGTGKCWFNHTWTENDAVLQVDCGEENEDLKPELKLNRIDAVVVEVNSSNEVKDNFIKVIKGEPDLEPSRPIMVHTDTLNQYALAYIYRPAESTEITQSDITNAVGSEETPFITGILDVISMDKLLGQWQDDLNRFMASEKDRVTANLDAFEDDFEEWYSEMKTLMEDAIGELNTWTSNQKTTVLNWFESTKNLLSTDSAVALQNQIDEAELKNILLFGFMDCTKTITNKGMLITSVDPIGRTLVRTFSEDLFTITSVLTDENNTVIGRMVKTISRDGTEINTNFTLYPYTI